MSYTDKFRDPVYWEERKDAMVTSNARLAARDALDHACAELLCQQHPTEEACAQLAVLARAYKAAHEANALAWAEVAKTTKYPMPKN